MNELLALALRVSALEKRLAQAVKHGTVSDVDPAQGLVRLNLGPGDDGDLKSPWMPYSQIAGALKAHTPPSVGQQMTYLAPGGDPQQAIALSMTWSENNESPSDKGDENVFTFGDVRITLDSSSVLIEVGGFKLRVSGAGLAMQGGGVGHDGQDIGATHRHPGIMPGGGITQTPIASGPTP